MTPQTKPIVHETTEEHPLHEEFVRQVEDHSLPAQEVLNDQQGGRAPNAAPGLFVP